MKYINKRENFLKEYNSTGLGDRVELIKEDSGPFANDILWGDSLLGRLINSAIRKTVIANNLRKMDSVEKRLIYAMDQLVGDSTIEEMPEEDKQTYSKALIFSFLYNLQKAVEDDEPLQELKNLTNTCISHVEKTDNIEDKDDLLNQLKEWKKFLDSIEEDKEEVQEEKEEESNELTYDLCLDNFKSVYDILIAYKKVKDQKAASVEVGKEYLYNGKVVKIISVKNVKTVGNDKQWMTGDDGTGETVAQPGAFAISRSSDGKYPPQLGFKVTPAKLKPLNEEVDIAVDGGVWKEKQKNKVVPVNKPDTSVKSSVGTPSIFNSIKPVYDYFMTEPDILKDMDTYFKYKKEGKTTKDSIIKVYNYIRKINENLDNFLTRPEKIGEKLSGLYKVTKTKPDGSFEGIDDDMKAGIASFNDSMSKILVSKPKDVTSIENEEPKENTNTDDDIDFDNKNRSTYENKLMKFSSFIKVYEADTFETPPVEPPTPKPGDDLKPQGQAQVKPEQEGPKSAIKNIQEWWHNNMKIDKWLIDDTEKEEINTDLSSKLKNTKKLTIPDIDYVIEICKIFNNAYRLHTTQVIPSGRKGGKVSNMTFREYTTFGNGTPENAGVSGGPYRNNKLFQHWYEKVMDVLKDRKYQPIFNIGTRIKMGDDYIEKAGSFLAKFMRDMLDGDGFFKEGQNQQGAQVKFLDKYFGYKGDDKLDYSADNVKTTPTPDEKSGTKFTFVKRVLPYENLRELSGSFFAIDKDGTPRYFYVNDVKGDYVYVKFSDSFAIFKEKMFPKSSVTIEGGSINLDKESDKGNKYLLKSTKIKFTDLVQNSGTINKTSFSDTKYITEPEGTEKNYGNWPFKNIYTLVELKGNVQTTKDQVRAKSTNKYTDMVSDVRLKEVEFK